MPSSSVTCDVLNSAIKRLDDLRDAESKRVDDLMDLHDRYATSQADLLASQVSASAEILRVTAAEVAQQSSQFNARLASLERHQSESRGSGSGTREAWGWVIAIVSILSGVVYAILKK